MYTCMSKRSNLRVSRVPAPKPSWGIGRAAWENSHPETDPKYQNVYENQVRRLSMSLRHFTKMEESFELTVMRR